MAYRRSITTRAAVLARHRFSPSFSYIHREDDDRKRSSIGEAQKIDAFLQWRSFGGGIGGSMGLGALTQEQRCSQYFVSPMTASLLSRRMSTTIGEEANKIGYISDVAEVISEKTAEVLASPAVSEVAVAAADSYLPVAALQYLIDGVHNLTGLNWWAAIVITTLMIRGAMVPLLINQLKATSKLSLMRPRLEAINKEMQDKGMDPNAVSDGQKRIKDLFKEYGVTPFTPLKGLLFQGPIFISFFLGITNMVEKVPSFKGGGAFWFVDLTTPDTLYIFPVLTALTFWITVECNAQEGLEGNPVAGTMKKVSRVFAVLTVPITMNFPKAIFCYWITSNLFSLMYGLFIKRPGVKKFLGVPIIPVAPAPTTAPQPSLSFSETIKKISEAMQQATRRPPLPPPEAPKLTDRKMSSSLSSSTSVISQRLQSLEKQVKGRKKGKKR